MCFPQTKAGELRLIHSEKALYPHPDCTFYDQNNATALAKSPTLAR
jgi:hypothetical protein